MEGSLQYFQRLYFELFSGMLTEDTYCTERHMEALKEGDLAVKRMKI